MIDLHMHTTYSDGSDSLIDVLKKCEEKKLSVISITDHNTCDGYLELERINVKDYYSGHIIVGIELNTRAAEIPIELLGYNIDYKKMIPLLEKTYISSSERNRIEFERLIQKCYDAGIKLDEDVIDQFDPNSFASIVILRNITHYEENRDKINERSWGSLRDFYRDYMSNPDTPLYVDSSDLVPDLDTTISLIKEADGLVFVPHIYEYRDNTPKVLDELLKNGKIDGFECYYSTFTDEQHDYILNLSREKGYLISGGSDYHGKPKPTISLGIGSGNLNIPDSIIDNWAKFIY